MTPDMRYESMTADVISLLDRLGINDAIWVGHSMGGKVAMTAALKDPSRVRALAVVDMAPVTYTHNFDDVLLDLMQLICQRCNRAKRLINRCLR